MWLRFESADGKVDTDSVELPAIPRIGDRVCLDGVAHGPGGMWRAADVMWSPATSIAICIVEPDGGAPESPSVAEMTMDILQEIAAIAADYEDPDQGDHSPSDGLRQIAKLVAL